MVNDLITGLSRTLYDNFDGVTIYVDNVEQGFETPSFFVYLVSSFESPLLGNRAKRVCLFDIHYFPKTEKNEELQGVASKLYVILRQIKLLNGDSINGFKLEHEIDDGVLHFFVKYNPIIYYPSVESEAMSNITNQTTIEVN